MNNLHPSGTCTVFFSSKTALVQFYLVITAVKRTDFSNHLLVFFFDEKALEFIHRADRLVHSFTEPNIPHLNGTIVR